MESRIYGHLRKGIAQNECPPTFLGNLYISKLAAGLGLAPLHSVGQQLRLRLVGRLRPLPMKLALIHHLLCHPIVGIGNADVGPLDGGNDSHLLHFDGPMIVPDYWWKWAKLTWFEHHLKLITILTGDIVLKFPPFCTLFNISLCPSPPSCSLFLPFITVPVVVPFDVA